MPKFNHEKLVRRRDRRHAQDGAAEKCFCGGEERIEAILGELDAANTRVAQLAAQVERLAALLDVERRCELSAAEVAQALLLLTPRESEVLLLFIEQPCDKAIANRLGTKLQTVKNQIASIEHKLEVDSREELYALFATAIRRGD